MNKKILIFGIMLAMVATIFVALLPNVSAKTILDETTEIEDREAYELQSNGATAWTIEIESTEPIDIRMMDEDNYNHWQKGESYKSYTAANVDDCTSKTYTVNLPAGKWYITLDNEDNEYFSEVWIRITAEDIETGDDNGGNSPDIGSFGFIAAIGIAIAVILISKKQKKRR